MDSKKVFQYILAAFIGFLVIWQLYGLAFTGLILTTLYLMGEIGNSLHQFNVMLGIVNIIIVMLGVYIGIWSYRKQNLFHMIFNPEKNKILISLILSLILVGVSLLVNLGNFYIIGIDFVQKLNPVAGSLGALITYAFLFYPFSCITYYIFSHRKKLQTNIRIMLLGLMIIMNPIFILISVLLSVLITSAFYFEPCGVTYQDFTSNSAAKDAGMSPQEVIVKIDETEIRSYYDMKKYLDNISYNKTIKIITDQGKEYDVTLRFNETENKYRIGIYLVSTETCNR